MTQKLTGRTFLNGGTRTLSSGCDKFLIGSLLLWNEMV